MTEGKRFALVLAFLSFLSVLVLVWLVLLNDLRFADGKVIFALAAFFLMGVGSGSIASTDGSKKQ